MATQSESNSVIHRKAKVARDEFDARAMSPSKALRLSLEKSADRLFALALTVSTVEQVACAHAALARDVGNDGLLVLLDGKDGARGALKLDLAFLTAVVEVQIKGKVTPGEVDARAVTRTDAAMAALLIDDLLAGMDAQLTSAGPGHRTGGFQYGDFVEDARSMCLALDAPDYDVFRLTADLGQGAKTGVMTIILPKVPDMAPRAKDAKGSQARPFDLREPAMNAPVTLDAVVARMSMPLDRICALTPGACVPVDMAALGKTELVGAKGHVVARVKLGQLNGFRAVRLVLGDADDRPVDDVADQQPATPALQQIGAISVKLPPDATVPGSVVYASDVPDAALTDLPGGHENGASLGEDVGPEPDTQALQVQGLPETGSYATEPQTA